MFEDQEIYQFEDLDHSSLLWLDHLLSRCHLPDKQHYEYQLRIDSIDIDDLFSKDEFNEILKELYPLLPDAIDSGNNYSQTDILKKLKKMGL